MLTQTDIERIGRYINGIADAGDQEWIENFFAHGHHNKDLKYFLKDDWENVFLEHIVAETNLDGILIRVHRAIRARESQAGKRRSFLYRIRSIYTKAAAVLLLPLIIAGGIYFGFYRDSPITVSARRVSTTIYAPMGSRVTFNLPDGTKGWLNSGSKLSYSLPFDENRNLVLEGEAWFDVFYDEKCPFEIIAGESRIRVLGTSFNVNAYPDEEYTEVILQDGEVEFSNRVQKEKIILKPSEQLVLQEGKLHILSVDVSKYKAWTNGELTFRGDTMAEVARRIERWYNVNVEIADEDLYRFSFRATFQDETLEDVLDQLSLTSRIEYKIVPREQLPDGTSKKRKVILNTKK